LLSLRLLLADRREKAKASVIGWYNTWTLAFVFLDVSDRKEARL
jgi:hypothetical protein